MAFSSGNSGGPMADINVTPLVDVMLVLLIIFIITAPLMSHKVKVELPQANLIQKEDAEKRAAPITLAVKEDGSLYWNDEPISKEALSRACPPQHSRPRSRRSICVATARPRCVRSTRSPRSRRVRACWTSVSLQPK